jgi:hypothetical protein
MTDIFHRNRHSCAMAYRDPVNDGLMERIGREKEN